MGIGIVININNTSSYMNSKESKFFFTISVFSSMICGHAHHEILLHASTLSSIFLTHDIIDSSNQQGNFLYSSFIYFLCTYKRSYAHTIITKCIFSLILSHGRQHLVDKIEQTTQLVVRQTYLEVIPLRQIYNRAEQSANQHRQQNDACSATILRHGISKVSNNCLQINS